MQEDLSNDWFDDYIEDYRERIEVLTRLKKKVRIWFCTLFTARSVRVRISSADANPNSYGIFTSGWRNIINNTIRFTSKLV